MNTGDLRGLIDRFNAHDIEAILSVFTDDAVLDAPTGPQPGGRRFVGKEEIRRALVAAFQGAPDVRYDDERHLVAGERGVSEWLLTGTTPEGERRRFWGCDLWEFRAGKVERWSSYRKTVVRLQLPMASSREAEAIHGRASPSRSGTICSDSPSQRSSRP